MVSVQSNVHRVHVLQIHHRWKLVLGLFLSGFYVYAVSIISTQVIQDSSPPLIATVFLLVAFLNFITGVIWFVRLWISRTYQPLLLVWAAAFATALLLLSPAFFLGRPPWFIAVVAAITAVIIGTDIHLVAQAFKATPSKIDKVAETFS